jgi:hypothetical protein
MKKKISGKLSLGKRSIASLTNEDMNQVNGGITRTGCGDPDYTNDCYTNQGCGTNTCDCPTNGCVSNVCTSRPLRCSTAC